MAKKQSGANPLLAAIARAAEQPKTEPIQPAPAKEVLPAASKKVERTARSNAARTSRVGTRLIAGHFDPAVARQLRLLAAEEDTTIQALLAEALNLLFVKKGKGKLPAGSVREQGESS